jgi:hypothetical protein
VDPWAGPRPGPVAEAVDEEFWAIVCGDEDLLAAEFEAVVGSMESGRRPRDARGRASGPQRRRPRHEGGWPAPAGPTGADRDPATAVQRSPPADPAVRPMTRKRWMDD